MHLPRHRNDHPCRDVVDTRSPWPMRTAIITALVTTMTTTILLVKCLLFSPLSIRCVSRSSSRSPSSFLYSLTSRWRWMISRRACRTRWLSDRLLVANEDDTTRYLINPLALSGVVRRRVVRVGSRAYVRSRSRLTCVCICFPVCWRLIVCVCERERYSERERER